MNAQVVTILGVHDADLSALQSKGLSLHVVFMLIPLLRGIGLERHGQILKEVAGLVDEGRLRPLLDSQI